jgi:Zn-dependent protease
VLFAIGSPLSLLLLLVSFVVAVTLQGWVSSVVAARQGDRSVRVEGRTAPDPRRHLDPFGTVSAAIAGVGWPKAVEAPDRRRRGAMVAVLLSGPVANLVVGLGALVALGVTLGAVRLASSGFLTPSSLLQDGAPIDLGERALLLFGLANLLTGLLALIPLPPLPGGRLLFGLAPRTVGWQKAEYQLVERNIGVAVLLALLLIPLAGQRALLSVILDAVAAPLVRLVTGG